MKAMLPLISVSLISGSQASAVVPVPLASSPSSTRISGASIGSLSLRGGVKLASLTAYFPAIDGGSLICIASTDVSPSRVDAPTVIAQGPPAGEPIVPRFGPSLPAATTASTPALVAFISAMSSGAVICSIEVPTE